MIVNNLTKPFLFICLALLSCGKKAEDKSPTEPEATLTPATETEAPVTTASYDTLVKTIHVYVALCDNKYQGIVPVPKAIGNGQDPDNNLYWGCGYGIRTYFKKSTEWKLLKKEKKIHC